MSSISVSARALVAACLVSVTPALAAGGPASQDDADEGYDFHVMRRLNVHGDEYNSVAASADTGRLVVGTEKGEVVVWSVARGRPEKRLSQGSPVHAVVALGDGRRFVAAGGWHSGASRSSAVRVWDVENGEAREWPGVGDESLLLLSCDARAGVVAGATAEHVVVWSAREGGRLLASWEFGEMPVGLAVAGRDVYVALADAESAAADGDGEIPPNSLLVLDAQEPARAARTLMAKEEGRLWFGLAASPDGRLLAANYYEGDSSHVALLSAADAREVATFDGNTPVWFAPDGLVVFDSAHPSHLIRLDASGSVARDEKFDDLKGWHGAGEPEDFHGAVVDREGKTAWGVLRQGAGLARWRLDEKGGRGELLAYTPSLVYAMDVTESPAPGLVITGGDDGFVRVWRLSDFQLLREFAVPFGVPQGVALTNGGRRAVFSYSGKALDAQSRTPEGVRIVADSNSDAKGEKKGAKTKGDAKDEKTGESDAREEKSPTEVVAVDLESGAQELLLSLKEPYVNVFPAGDGFVYASGRSLRLASPLTGETLREFVADGEIKHVAVSNNRRWLAASDEGGSLYLFEVATGRRVKAPEKVEDLTCLAASNDGRRVYTTEFKADIRRWDVAGGKLEDVGGLRGQCSTLRLSKDEERFVVGGNHHDVAVYDARSGQRVGYFLSDAADFYVTNAWLAGDRLFFTADGGVLYDGVLKPARDDRRK